MEQNPGQDTKADTDVTNNNTKGNNIHGNWAAGHRTYYKKE